MENHDPNQNYSSSGASIPSTASTSASISSSSTGVLMTKKQTTYQGATGARNDELSSGIDWVDSVVDVATTCKKIFTAHTCRLCQVYTDAQVEYEVRQEESLQQQQQQQQQQRHHSTNSYFQSIPNSLEVELYRQFLFDEDSVVEAVNEREKDLEELHSTVTQRTH